MLGGARPLWRSLLHPSPSNFGRDGDARESCMPPRQQAVPPVAAAPPVTAQAGAAQAATWPDALSDSDDNEKLFSVDIEEGKLALAAIMPTAFMLPWKTNGDRSGPQQAWQCLRCRATAGSQTFDITAYQAAVKTLRVRSTSSSRVSCTSLSLGRWTTARHPRRRRACGGSRRMIMSSMIMSWASRSILRSAPRPLLAPPARRPRCESAFARDYLSFFRSSCLHFIFCVLTAVPRSC